MHQEHPVNEYNQKVMNEIGNMVQYYHYKEIKYKDGKIDLNSTFLKEGRPTGNAFYFSNMVIDNLVYQDRKSYNVQREIINNYTLFTDPIKQDLADDIIDLYLLSEFELYASDHNPFNFSSEFKDTELIVEESPTLEYIDFTNLVKITAKLQDKKKDKLTKYNG